MVKLTTKMLKLKRQNNAKTQISTKLLKLAKKIDKGKINTKNKKNDQNAAKQMLKLKHVKIKQQKCIQTDANQPNSG